MNFIVVEIDCNQITDWDSFHDVFSESFGYPDFYGRNMNAWNDCMYSLDAPEDGMTSIHAPENGSVVLQLNNVRPFRERAPELYAAIVECTAFVNWSRLETDKPPVLFLSFTKSR